MPPVVDPVHYGIHSAEPLWPIRGSKLPQFHLPPEAMLAASSTEQRWRTRQASRLHKTDVTTTPRTQTLFKPSQRTDRPDHHHHHRLPHFHRHPVRSTAWKRYDHPSNQLIGRSPALGPPLPVVLPTFRPGGVAVSRPTSRPAAVILPMSRPRVIPPNTSGSSSSRPTAGQQQRLLAGRQRADLPPPANRYVSSNARSYESVIDDGANNGLLHYGISHHSLSAGKADGIDRADDDDIDGLLLNDTSSESLLPPPGNEKKKDVTVSDQHHHQQRKRAKKPFFPFQFVIQSGYSKVRKYGNEIKESLSAADF